METTPERPGTPTQKHLGRGTELGFPEEMRFPFAGNYLKIARREVASSSVPLRESAPRDGGAAAAGAAEGRAAETSPAECSPVSGETRSV